jgi:type VI secretion system secreted protein VgrG
LHAWISIDALETDAEVLRLHAREGLSTLFDLDVRFVCDTGDLDLDAMLWRPTCVRVARDGEDVRVFHGVIEEAEWTATRAQRHVYRVRVRPRVHGLAYRVRSRIFQGMTALEVVDRVLRDAGLGDEDFDLGGLGDRYPTREFCVQYKESELDFVLRLLEDEGVFYWFEHDLDGHRLRVGDAPTAHEAMEAPTTLAYSRTEHAGREHLTDLVRSARATTGQHVSNDWNFLDASHVLEAEFSEDGQEGYIQHDWPGGFLDVDDGARRAQDRLLADRATQVVITARSNCGRLRPGAKFDLADAQPSNLNGEHLVVALEHRFVSEAVAMEAPGTRRQPWEIFLEAIPAEVPFKPARVTPRPRVSGVESAVVTGPPGEEIHVDAWGRIKVHFYWDREGGTDDAASCWIRAQQQNTSGAMILPRVGWEVSVAFLDGDPDRPVMLQKLYNAETMPPYAHPENNTQAALQSATYPGGGATNEVRLQDGNGGMEFFVHASRDLDVRAGNNLGEDIDVDDAEEVGLNRRSSVGGDESVTVGGARSLNVTGTAARDVTGDASASIGGVDDVGVKGSSGVTVAGDRSETIGGMMTVLANTVTENIGGDLTRTVGAVQLINSATSIVENVQGAKTETISGAHVIVARKAAAETVGAARTLNAGAAVLKAGADISMTAGGAVTYTVGGAMVEQCGDAWSIAARTVVVTAPGGVDVDGGGAKLSLKGGSIKYNASALKISGTAMVTLKGNIKYK